MSDYRVINRKQCRCGSTEISTEVIVHVYHATDTEEQRPELKSPEVPVITCEICNSPTDQPLMRR